MGTPRLVIGSGALCVARALRCVMLVAAISMSGGSAALTTSVPLGLLYGVLGDDGQPIPVDADGLPGRRLSDAELHRLLLHLSRFMDAASLRLALCHAQGLPYGATGWRECIERPWQAG